MPSAWHRKSCSFQFKVVESRMGGWTQNRCHAVYFYPLGQFRYISFFSLERWRSILLASTRPNHQTIQYSPSPASRQSPARLEQPLDDGGWHKMKVGRPIAGQPTNSATPISDLNGVSWGDGGCQLNPTNKELLQMIYHSSIVFRIQTINIFINDFRSISYSLV